MSQMIYDVKDKVPFNKLILFGIQEMLSVFVATVLIAQICSVSISGALVGAALSTIVYVILTKFKSPMFLSNSGAFVTPIITAMALGGYTAIAIGGLVTCIIYLIFGVIFTRVDVDKIYRIFPKALIGSVTVVIGVNLMAFINTYVQIDGQTLTWGIVVAFITAISIALISHYSKGVIKILPFLIGTLIGYIISIILTLIGVCDIVDFSIFNNIRLIQLPDFAFMHLEKIDFTSIFSVVILFIAFTISAMMECLSDHAALGGIIGKDLYKDPGLGKIFIGEGIANVVGTLFGGLGICSYGEGVACVGFSKVASTFVTITAAVILGLLGFIGPVQAFIASIPSCVFAGCAIILYGFISCSGIKILQQVNLDNQKNLIVVSSVLSLGISGLVFGNEIISISGTALALIFGVILNLILKDKKDE